MCFSAEASFTVGAALVPAGGYCLWSAVLKKPSYLGLAAIPTCFGIQQISEGFVWHALAHDDRAEIRVWSLVFLFFALAFWPFWFPFLTMLMEPNRPRKAIFLALSILATTWFWVLFYPLVVGPELLLTTRVEHHSIQYEYADLAVYQHMPDYSWIHPVWGSPKTFLRLLYLLTIALPPIMCTESWGRVSGLILGASAVLAVLVFDHACVSVWCFFAAVMAVYLCVVFHRLPKSQANAALAFDASASTV